MKIVEIGDRIYEITYVAEAANDDVVIELSELSGDGFIGLIRLGPSGNASLQLEHTEIPLVVLHAWVAEAVYPTL